MSKDIRSFFCKPGKSNSATSKPVEQSDKQSKKKRRRIIESDEEDNDLILPVVQKKKLKEKDKSPIFTNKKQSEVIVKVENFFDSKPVIQKKQEVVNVKNDNIVKAKKTPEKKKSEKPSKKKKADVCDMKIPEFECDDELEKSILQTDDEELISYEGSVSKKDRPNQNSKSFKTIEKQNDNSSGVRTNLKSPTKSPKVLTITTPKQKQKELDAENSEILNSEQKRKNAAAYQKYLQRGGPKNPGSKKIPEGTPTCLKGLNFVITGVLDSMEREEAADLIQKCGGSVKSQVSKKTNYLILGEEGGNSKIQKAENFGTKIINEDELLNLIKEKSNDEPLDKDCFIENTPEKSSKYFNQGKKRKSTPDSVEKEFSSHSKVLKKSEKKEGKTEVIIDTKPIKTSLAQQRPELSSSKSIKEGLNDQDQQKVQFAEEKLWVEKYKPSSTKTIIGQGGDRSNVKKLIYWLQNWHKNHSSKSKKKPFRPAPWSQSDDGSFYKAALLSGPPGVGKTTAAHLVCKELGFDMIEFNASDTRSKRLLQEEVSELLSSKSLKGYLHAAANDKASLSNQVLVMDEVDGMAGNEDRGGVQELIQLVKNTKVPILCICNDRSHPKMRSFLNYCFDLRFSRPPVKQIKGAMMSICFKEKIDISGEALEELIISSNQDIRQVLHRLSLLASGEKSLSYEAAKKNGNDGKKPLNLNPWDVIRKVFSSSEQEKMSLNDKIDLFFQDYSLGPLFVQDSYVHVRPRKAENSKHQTLSLLSNAADSLAVGDIIDRAIRSYNSWNLLPTMAIFSSVLPGHYMCGHFQDRIDFPAWLGKNSKTRKFSRILQELHTALGISISGDSQAVNLDYLKMLKDSIVRPLIKKGVDGIDESVQFMLDYNLNKEDFDHILELSAWPDMKDVLSYEANVDSKVKSAFTRTLNKKCQAVSHAAKRITKNTGNEFETEEEKLESDIETEENDNVDLDPMIKKGKSKSTAKQEPSTSKNVAKKESAKKGKGKEKKK